MAQFVVERHLPGFTGAQLQAAAASAKKSTAEMTREGTPIRYLRSLFIPGEDKCFCLFDGPSPEAVREANKRAKLPVERIAPAIGVVAEELR